MLYAVGSHAHGGGESERRKNIMYGWMPGKKKEEILGMQKLVLGLMQQHAVSCVADIGTGSALKRVGVYTRLCLRRCAI